jgi:predicted pyridoxine 5'-phosphate oxidase superfamily flavin-nucleotide-binding protein
MDTRYHFHEGERGVQRRVGEVAQATSNSAMISPAIAGGAIRFLSQQPMVVFGTRDRDGDMWASPLFGEPGFVTAPTDQLVLLDLTKSLPVPGDPLWENAATDPAVGMIALELASRRRLRINGQLHRAEDLARLSVEWAYPNCPKYIQRRRFTGIQRGSGPESAVTGVVLTAEQQQLIHGADTLFVASAHPERGVDCSHRGGNPGFVQVLGGQELLIPDYVGNSMFNTLGNFLSYPRAGIVFLDFDGGQALSVTGDVSLDFDMPGTEEVTGGTQRFWRLRVRKWRHAVMPTHLTWEYVDPSPYNPEVACPWDITGASAAGTAG